MAARTSMYVESEGPNVGALYQGFVWLVQTCQVKKRTEALLAIPTRSNLDGAVTDVIGSEAVAALVHGKRVELESISLSLFMANSRNPLSDWSGPILAVYPSRKLLNQLDNMVGVSDILIVPWLQSDIEEWIGTWSALKLGATQEKASSLSHNMNPIVVEALKSLTNTANLLSGKRILSDRGAAIDLFQRLHNAQIEWEPQKVRAWLVQHNWETDSADSVRDIATKIQQGKSLRGGKTFWRDDIVDLWRKSAPHSED